ncbi:MAG: acyltransferase [Bacteroidales bacterium]|jgi:hypothetical protein|nr:acyltransferase [Bacteroidales bacterium]
MNINLDFEDTRPYYNEEIPDAIKRVSEDIYFRNMVNHIFPDIDIEAFTKNFKKIRTVNEFQEQVMDKVIRSIIKETSAGLSYSGLSRLSTDKNYMFISNHRDILLDSAILQVILHECGLDTSEITFGSNLMSSPLVIDIGKMNKMFKIVRGGTMREIFNNSLKVSQYMRYAITEKRQSTWIAQRNGRTKNGFDATEMAVLKMFAMSSSAGFVDNLMELNITPVIISYEYEPCDALKTRERYISKRKTYIKENDEDMFSVLRGIKQWKGQIHLAVAETITEEELQYCDSFLHNEKFKSLVKIIDHKIYKNYALWKTNYIAFDMLRLSNKYAHHYSQEEKEAFKLYMTNELKGIEGDIKELETIFLQIYATPVENCSPFQDETAAQPIKKALFCR